MIGNKIYGMSNECPEEVQSWMKSQMFYSPIWFKNGKDSAECYCGECGGFFYYDYLSRDAIRGKLHIDTHLTCPLCKHEGIATYRTQTRGRCQARSFYYFRHINGNDLAVSVYDITKFTIQPAAAKYTIEEAARYIIRPNKAETYRKKWKYFDRDLNEPVYAWVANKTGRVSIQAQDAFPGWQEKLGTCSLTYFRPDDYASYFGYNVITREIAKAYAYANCPSIELFAKCGMRKLATAIIDNDGRLGVINRKGKTMNAQLRLKDKEHINMLKAEDGDPQVLQVLQYLEKEKKKMSADDIRWIIRCGVYYFNSIKKILNYMSITQLRNRTVKYRQQQPGYSDSSYCDAQIVREYSDYLTMREELGYDMTNEVYLHPRNLHEAHQKMVDERNGRRDKDFLKRKDAQYKDIPKRYESLEKKYGYKHEGFVISVPRKASDIIMEGRKMHHCVGTDGYLSKHNNGTTSILFLRYEDHPKTPFVTIEVKGTQILQWYEAHDTQGHKDIVNPFLNEWIEQIKGGQHAVS